MKRALEWIAVVAVLALAAALRYVDPRYLVDLAIVPDSAQYTVAGYNLAHGRGLWIYINDLKLPLMYPCGFPAILAAWYTLTGMALHSAIYLVLACGLLSILLTYCFARSVFGRPTALCAALLLSVAPSSVGYSQVLISDMISNVFVVAGLWMAWEAAVRGENVHWLWFAAGVLCGLSATVHILRVVTLLPLCAACLFAGRGGVRGLFAALVCALAGFAVGFSPVLAYNGIAFGNVFRTGYYYWERWEGGRNYLSLSYALRNTAVSERGDQAANIYYFMLHFLGLSWPTLFAPYFPAVLLLAIFGAVWCIRGAGAAGRERAFATIAISFILGTLFLLFFYAYQMAKFLLPTVPFMCMLAAWGIRNLVLFAWKGGNRTSLLRGPVAVLMALTAWGCVLPFARGHFSHTLFPWRWYEGMSVLDRIATPDAILVSGIDGVFVTHYFVRDTHRLYMPIVREVEYIRQKRLPLRVAMEDQAYLAAAAAGGRKVYMDGYTYREWGRYRAALERNFVFVPVAPYCGGALHIFELRPKTGV